MYSLEQKSVSWPSSDRLRVAFIGGGSRSWARTMMNDLALAGDLAGDVFLYDVDHESAVENARLGNQIQERDEAEGDWHYEAVERLSDALDGADFVLVSTQDPPAETMVHDLDLPAEYGIYQPVGDTVGPGGTFRAMRAIPQFREIAAAIRDHCPDAWVLNFTNPMTVCVRTLYEEFPDIKAVGICHEVYGTQRYLAKLVERHLDVERPNSHDIDVDVKGINHFTWIDGARWEGRDILPLVRAELEAREPIPGEFEPGDLDDESYYVNNHLVALDLFRRFGCFPAAGDRHLAEFVPWYLNVEEPTQVQRWGIRLTPSEHRVDHWPGGEQSRRRYLRGDESFEFDDSGEEMVDIIRALAGGTPLRTNVNLPNRGQVAGLARKAVVETNALLTTDSITPLAAGSLPKAVQSLVVTHVENQEALVRAGFAGDLDLAFGAFLSEPLVTLQPDAARDLFANLVAAERSYLTDWNLAEANVLTE